MFRFRGDLPAVSHCRAMSRRFKPVLVWYGSAGPPSVPVRVMVAVPTALSRPHAARDRGCGRCNSEDRRQQVGIFSKFRQVSEITKDRLHIVDFPADLLAGIVLSGAGEILDYGASVRVRYRVLPGGVPGVLTGPYPGVVRAPGPVSAWCRLR